MTKTKGEIKVVVNHHPVPEIPVPAPVLLPVIKELAEIINNGPLHYYEKVLKKIKHFFIDSKV